MAKLYFYYATMNAGKTTALLQTAYNYHEKKMRTVLLTSATDDRYKKGIISSRIGFSAPATTYRREDDLWQWFMRTQEPTYPHCILLDEAQFLSPEQVWDLSRIVDTFNVPILCYGLRTDFKGELFSGSSALLAIADVLSEIKSMCHCGAKATMNLRIQDNMPVLEGDIVMIGGNDVYDTLCRRCFTNKKQHHAHNQGITLSKVGSVV